MKFGTKVQSLCAARGWNRATLARAVRVSKTAVSSWVADGKLPRLDTALCVARAFGVPLDYLADDARDEPPAAEALSPDAVAVLKLYRALRLTEDEAMRRLACPADNNGDVLPIHAPMTDDSNAARVLPSASAHPAPRGAREANRLG